MSANRKIIALNEIVVKKEFNSRILFNVDKMDELKKSILSKGLMYPILVKEVKITTENISDYEIFSKGQKQNCPKDLLSKVVYCIVDGERRYRSYVTLIEEGHPIKGICCEIVSKTTKEDDAIMASFLRNTGENFTPIEGPNRPTRTSINNISSKYLEERDHLSL